MNNIDTRTVRPDERQHPTHETETPLVIEARASSEVEALCALAARETPALKQALADHGAILFRGFHVKSAEEFERVVLSLGGMRGMADVLMSEEGRTVVGDTRFVLHTNEYYRTGGAFDPPRFHTENYYVPDVPRFISFFCESAPWMGGETALVNMAGVFADLPAALQHKLEARTFFVGAWPVDEIAARYGVAASELEAMFGDVLDFREGHLALYKPIVLQHPVTKAKALQLNVSAELNKLGLGREIDRHFDYSAARWALHRATWRHPAALSQLVTLEVLLRSPRFFARERRRRQQAEALAPFEKRFSAGSRIREQFAADEIALLGAAIARRSTSFSWRRGDVLVIDNLRMAHAGMPGFGPRVLRALICNPIPLVYRQRDPGLYAVPADDVAATFGEQLTARLARPTTRAS